MSRWRSVVVLGTFVSACGDDGSSSEGGGTVGSSGQTVSDTELADGSSGAESVGVPSCPSLTDVLIVASPMIGDPSTICGNEDDPESLGPIGTLIDTDDGDLAVCVGLMGPFSTDEEPSSQVENLPRPTARYFGLYTYEDDADPNPNPEQPHYVALEVALHAGGAVASGCRSSRGFGTHSGSSYTMAGVQAGESVCPTDDARWRIASPAEITVELSTGVECDVTLHEIAP